MPDTIIFIHLLDRPELVEAEIDINASSRELEAILSDKEILLDAETLIFIDEADEPIVRDRHGPLDDLRHGAHIHLSRHHRIKVTVNFVGEAATKAFPPGARVRAVKAFAVHEFKMSAADAAEHVLQISGTTERPASDVPLHSLAKHHGHEIHFDFVPEKRVEGQP